MNTIKLNIVLSLVLEAIKAETHIKGAIDKSLDDNASRVAYNEEAGDEEFHERKLMRTIQTSIEELKVVLGDFLLDTGETQADNFVSQIDNDNDTITISIAVTSRFNKAFTSSLAQLCSDYIQNHSLVLWWGTFNAKQAEFYAQIQQANILAIRRCFNKTAPLVPNIQFPHTLKLIIGTVQTDKPMGAYIKVGEAEEIGYAIDDNTIDDIIAVSSNPNVVQVWQMPHSRAFVAKALRQGQANIRVFSRHNESLCITLKVIAAYKLNAGLSSGQITADGQWHEIPKTNLDSALQQGGAQLQGDIAQQQTNP